MARITVEDCLPLVENRFALVILATKRTRQLMDGARPLLDPGKNKPAVLALREVAEGKVKFEKSVTDLLSIRPEELPDIATLRPIPPPSTGGRP